MLKLIISASCVVWCANLSGKGRNCFISDARLLDLLREEKERTRKRRRGEEEESYVR